MQALKISLSETAGTEFRINTGTSVGGVTVYSGVGAFI